MAMSPYNRENPFMYLLETKRMELTQKTYNCIRRIIILMIEAGINILMWVIAFCVTHKPIYFKDILFVLYISFFVYLQLKRLVADSDDSDVQEMIFGNQYQNINLNNEKLLAHINFVNTAIGKADHFFDEINCYILMYAIYIAISVVFTMVEIVLIFAK